MSFAGRNKAGIEYEEDNDLVLVEVSLLTGTQQRMRESFSIHRHLEKYLNSKFDKVYSIFISPKSFIDTIRYFKHVNREEGLDTRIYLI